PTPYLQTLSLHDALPIYLPDSNFADSVVLVMNNIGHAPVGLIINRPTQVPLSRLFPDLKPLAQLHDKVYFGGPVEFGSVWFLFRDRKSTRLNSSHVSISY